MRTLMTLALLGTPLLAGDYGTTLEFLDSPKEAAAAAQKAEKLVFVLHVSGHFEDPGLT